MNGILCFRGKLCIKNDDYNDTDEIIVLAMMAAMVMLMIMIVIETMIQKLQTWWSVLKSKHRDLWYMWNALAASNQKSKYSEA